MFLFPMPVVPHSLPPNPALVAICLIITTRRGPRFVFHYPGAPEPSQPSNSWAFGSLGSDSEDGSGESSDDEVLTASDDAGDAGSRAGSVSGSSVNKGQGSLGGARTGTGTGRWSASAATTASTRRTARTLREDGPDDEEDVDDDIEDLDLAATEGSGAGNKESKTAEDGSGGGSKDKMADWEKVLGYPTEGLEKLLSPPDKFRKKKFEVTIEDLVFLGYPVFAKEGGSWKKRKRKAEKRDGDKAAGGEVSSHDESDGQAGERNPFAHLYKDLSEDVSTPVMRPAVLDSPELSPTTTRDDVRRQSNMPILSLEPDPAPISQSYGSTGGMSEAASEAKSMSTASASQNGDDMSMFHLVFVMNPPTLEYHIRVQEMYDNVVKKFSKALKYEQTRSGWVEREAKKILTMKTQAKESKCPPPMPVLWAKIMQQSSLAKAIANVYTSISSNKIAHVSIGSSFDASIQIPQAISTSYVATPMEPQLPGLWLTTASMLEDDDGVATLSPHAALLLLEDKETMLKEIESDNKEMTSPLAYFIRELSPTKSLQKLSTSLSLPLADMQFLARHLIYWRRARAVPPLHIRDTYIVSPNCDLRQLSKATTLYAQRFAALPSLPNMLQLLSGKPKQYGYLIPSKDHKAAYMEILAWLLRGGWVTQLRTFAWVKVTPAVKVAVAVQLRKEAEEKSQAKLKAGQTKSETLNGTKGNVLGAISSMSLSARRTYSEDDYTSPISDSRTSSKAKGVSTRRNYSEDDYNSSTSTSRKSSRSKASPRLDALLSPTIQPPRDRSVSDAASIASAKTTIPGLSPSTHPSPALTALRPSPLHTVDNINPLSPPNGFYSVATASSAPEPDTLSTAASAHTNDAATEAGGGGGNGAETLLSDSTLTLPSTEEADYETTLIPSPHKANTLESKWLARIGSELKDPELRDVWGSLMKYFDGAKAIEEIAGREGFKRRTVDELMARLEVEGVLLVVRHW